MTNNFSVNTEAAIYKNGKWLLGIRSKHESEGAGLLAFVGGTVEHSDALLDTLESAVIREVGEEIGVTVKVLDFVNTSSFVSKRGNHVINVVLLCEIIDGEPKILSPEEMDSLVWLTKEEVINHSLSPKWLCESIKKADELARNIFQN